MTTVSVYVPCYNYAHYLRECVESVLTQAEVDVEVLIIDDSSTDDSQEIGMDLASRDFRVEYRRHPINRGHIATYNEGIDWASGDYTVLLSADDRLTPGSLARATRLMDSRPDVGLAYGPCAIAYSDRPPPEPRTPDAPSYLVHQGVEWLEDLCATAHNRIWAPEAIVRTDLQKQLGGYRVELPHTADLEMWMRFALISDVVEILDADQAFYRIHGMNMHSRKFSALQDAQQRRAAFDSFFDEFGDDGLPSAHRLRRLANRSVARDAYWAASWAFDRGPGHEESVNEIIEFAAETYGGGLPDLRRPRAYLGYARARLSYGARTLMGSRIWPIVGPVLKPFEVKDAYI